MSLASYCDASSASFEDRQVLTHRRHGVNLPAAVPGLHREGRPMVHQAIQPNSQGHNDAPELIFLEFEGRNVWADHVQIKLDSSSEESEFPRAPLRSFLIFLRSSFDQSHSHSRSRSHTDAPDVDVDDPSLRRRLSCFHSNKSPTTWLERWPTISAHPHPSPRLRKKLGTSWGYRVHPL